MQRLKLEDTTPYRIENMEQLEEWLRRQEQKEEKIMKRITPTNLKFTFIISGRSNSVIVKIKCKK